MAKGRKCIKVKTLHGYTIEDLQAIIGAATSEYTRNYLMAVIMSYQNVHTDIIMNTLGKSRPTITRYINSWNKSPGNMLDNRGGNIPNRLTDEIIDDIKDIVINKRPVDFGYDYPTWTCNLLAIYVEDKYGKKFSDEWIRKLLKNLGFSYKKGVYKPSKADPELKEQFKKTL